MCSLGVWGDAVHTCSPGSGASCPLIWASHQSPQGARVLSPWAVLGPAGLPAGKGTPEEADLVCACVCIRCVYARTHVRVCRCVRCVHVGVCTLCAVHVCTVYIRVCMQCMCVYAVRVCVHVCASGA